MDQREVNGLYQIGLDRIFDQIRVSIYECIGSEKTYRIGEIGSDQTEQIRL